MPASRTFAALLSLLLIAAACSGDDGGSDADGNGVGAEPTASDGAEPVASTRGGTVGVPEMTELSGGDYGVAYNAMPSALAEEFDYVEDEYRIAGEATAYTADDLSTDGAWSTEPAGTAPYATRVITRRPADPEAFNGVVVVEWLNVSAGRDSDPDFGSLYPVLLEEGYGYIGVSAQQAGIVAGGAVLEVPGVPEEALLPLTEWDPERYGDLDHPGDAFSFDLLSQAAQVALRPSDGTAFADLTVTDVIAVGQSQSAAALATYVNGVHPLVELYDGFLVHGRGDGGLPLDAGADLIAPDELLLRTDLAEPIVQFETETDLIDLNFLAARQDDSDAVVTWEVAGTAHADQATLDYGVEAGQEWNEGSTVDFTTTCGEINDGPQAETLRAAFVALVAWIQDGTAPPTTPDLEVADGQIVRDDLGIAVGGARTPPADAPTAALTGANDSGSVFCSLFGGGEPLSEVQLAEVYDGPADYAAQVEASAATAEQEGWLLPDDAQAYVDDAEGAAIP